MPFTTVPDKATNDVFTEAMWDDYIKTNMNEGVMRAIAESVLSGTASQIEFTSINNAFRHLLLLVHARTDSAVTSTNLLMRLNTDSTAQYDYQHITATGATVTGAESFGQTSMRVGTIAGASAGNANQFGAASILLPHYQSTHEKEAIVDASLKTGTGASAMAVVRIAGFWRSGATISTITLLPAAGSFVSGSMATLYGLPR